MYERSLLDPVRQALADTPVVLVVGPRQAGKTTLVRDLLATHHDARYVTLDDATVLAAAAAAPQDFVDGLQGPVVIDEVQRVPGLVLAIKRSVDRDRTAGRFLLTGSADALQLPRVADALAGRVEPLTLWPLAQWEIAGRAGSFVDAIFAPGELPDMPAVTGAGPDRLAELVVRGGYPEAVARSGRRRSAWYESYLTTVLQREVSDLADIAGLADLPRLLAQLAARTGGLLNFADVARTADLPQTTLKRYLALLELTFLVRRIPAWTPNLGRRMIKSPKLYAVDSGLAAHLLGVDVDRLRADSALAGRLVESFVAMELVRHLGWSATSARLMHLRTAAGREVDLVLERRDGTVVGIEVKAASSVRARDRRGLETLRDALGDRFLRGLVLYAGAEALPLGDRITALPVSTLCPPG